MKVKTIPSSWITRDGLRLDCNPYMSGALEAKIRLEELSCKKEQLADLTSGYSGGIYNGPQFVRNFVDDQAYGVPFLGTSSMLRADLSYLPLLKKKDAQSQRLSFLRIEPGMTLISCSGTIGRMVYARPDMDGMWSNQDILKVVPDPDKVPAGYLYAFLSSKYGVPLVTSGTYGAIIQHIEPEHISGLPVPRLGNDLESKVSNRIEFAATCRSEAASLLKEAIALVMEILGPVKRRPSGEASFVKASAKQLQSRLDAFYYSPICHDARRSFDMAKDCEHRALGDVAEVFIPGIFKRRYAEDPSHGVPYITGGDAFQISPTSDKFLMKRVVAENDLRVARGMILVQEAGQLGGLIGRCVYVGERLDGFAVSNNMVRVTPRDPRDGGFIYALFSTAQGVTLISREAAGSSIPHMDASRLRGLSIPWPPARLRKEISLIVERAVDLRDKASVAERDARSLIEHAVEGAY